MPTSFREAAALVLIVGLWLIFTPVLIVALTHLVTDPRAVTIGDTTQVVDKFGRAEDLLAVVLPLLGAAITFCSASPSRVDAD